MQNRWIITAPGAPPFPHPTCHDHTKHNPPPPLRLHPRHWLGIGHLSSRHLGQAQDQGSKQRPDRKTPQGRQQDHLPPQPLIGNSSPARQTPQTRVQGHAQCRRLPGLHTLTDRSQPSQGRYRLSAPTCHSSALPSRISRNTPRMSPCNL